MTGVYLEAGPPGVLVVRLTPASHFYAPSAWITLTIIPVNGVCGREARISKRSPPTPVLPFKGGGKKYSFKQGFFPVI